MKSIIFYYSFIIISIILLTSKLYSTTGFISVCLNDDNNCLLQAVTLWSECQQTQFSKWGNSGCITIGGDIPSGTYRIKYVSDKITTACFSDCFSYTNGTNQTVLIICYGSTNCGSCLDHPKIQERLILNDYKLYQNYPNPFNPITEISYYLPKDENVNLKIYDLNGHDVKTLVNEFQFVGEHKITFDAHDLASGLYFYELSAGSFKETKKLLLIK